MKHISRTILIGVLWTSLLTSCLRDHTTDAGQWMINIKPGTTLEEVKRDQPDYVTIDWDNPDTVDNKVRYWITDIKGANESLEMLHKLIFVDNKYSRHEFGR